MEENSGVKFQQAMVALARQWVGDADAPSDPTTVSIALPSDVVDTTTLAMEGPKNELKTESYSLPRTVEEAKDIIEKFESGAEGLRSDETVSDNVVQHMLHDRTSLLDELWLGTEEEEKDAYVSELLYIHTKVMVVDDKRVIMGSANINDRSQKGDCDSEIALVVEDDDMIEANMNGQPYMVSRFAASLRRKLYREHLGLIPPQICEDPDETVSPFMRPAPFENEDEFGSYEDDLVADPLSDHCERLWQDTARKNREIFTEIFRPVPTNLIRSWETYPNYVAKVKAGHVAPEIPLDRVKDRLSLVRGALVEAPIDFLIDQKDFIENPEWSELNPLLPIYL